MKQVFDWVALAVALQMILLAGCGSGFSSFVRPLRDRRIGVVSVGVRTSWRDEATNPHLGPAALETTNMIEDRLSSSGLTVVPQSVFVHVEAFQQMPSFAPDAIAVGRTAQGRLPVFSETRSDQEAGRLAPEVAQALAQAIHVDYVATLVTAWRVRTRAVGRGQQVHAASAVRLHIYDASGQEVFSAGAGASSDRSLATRIELGRELDHPDEITSSHWNEATDRALATLLEMRDR